MIIPQNDQRYSNEDQTVLLKPIEAALIYANRKKWAVLPLHSIVDGRCTCGRVDCGSPGKHPKTVRGVKDASKDVDVVRHWWREWPNANVGIATGATSGFFVLDVDGEEGENSLAELEARHGALPDTVESLTGGGGRHLFFRWPGRAIKNKVALAPGLDVRSDNGYIVAPPSVHASGKRYAWRYLDEVPLAEAPTWLVDLLCDSTPHNTSEAATPPKIADLALSGVPEGMRDVTLFRYACSLRARGLSRKEVERLVLDAAAACVPPFPTAEALEKVESAWKYEPRADSHFTDMGNAERLVKRYGSNLHYCFPWRQWLVWDGTRWQEDMTGVVMSYAKETVKAMYADAGSIEDKNDRKAFLAFVMRSEQKDRLKAMVDLAASEPGVPVLPENLDTDPWLFNVANGTIDLRTGELRPHRREDLLTKLSPVVYDEAAKCPRWQQFLDEIMCGSEDLISFLQRAAGLSLTGDTSEHVLFVLYGRGRNGKSTFLNTLLSVMGDYGVQAAPDLLMARRGDRHPTELADLFGRRLVVSIESEDGRRMAESLVKQLTGGDRITARRMRQDFWTFTPTHHLFLATNHKPQIRGTDVAIWSRIKLIPFNVQFLDNDPLQDKHLFQKLLTELPGILKWCVEGCLAWQREGLGVPEEVKEATDNYRAEQDVVAAFLNDRCVVAPSVKAAVKDVYKAYLTWCEENGEKPLSQRELGARLGERGFNRYRGGATGNYLWRGLGLLADGEPPVF